MGAATSGTPKLHNPQNENQYKEDPVVKAIQIDLILQNIVSYLPVGDLKEFRLLSKQCNRVCVQTLRNKLAPIKINRCSDFKQTIKRQLKYKKRLTEAQVSQITAKYTEKNWMNRSAKAIKKLEALVLGNQTEFPCSEFEINTDFILQCKNTTFVRRFIPAVSSFVTKLEVDLGNDHKLKEIRTVEFPCLKYLSVKCNTTYYGPVHTIDYSSVHNSLPWFRKVLLNAPSLDTLHFEPWEHPEILNEYFKIISGTGCDASLKTLKILEYQANNIQACIQENSWLCLKEIDLRLKSLYVRSRFALGTKTFKTFLDSQADTLEDFTLRICDVSEICFPQMKKLTFLKMSANGCIFHDFSIASLFPSLKCLKLDIPKEFLMSALSQSTLSLYTLELLAICVCLDDNEILQQVAQMFPNLRRLETLGPKQATPCICTGMKNLKELFFKSWIH